MSTIEVEESKQLDFVPNDVREVMRQLHEAGFDVWLVGGAVRDFLSHCAPKDWDLATDATPEEVIGLFRVVIPVGIRHGTVLVRSKKRGIEVTTFAPSGLEGIKYDLNRRDFTLNAMAISYPAGRFLDPNNGEGDLNSGVLRAVGSAVSRFREDPLRTLRAGRFVSANGYSIHETTLAAIQSESHGLGHVAAERIREELLKLLVGKNVKEALRLMERTGVLDAILPEMSFSRMRCNAAPSGQDVFQRVLQTIEFCPKDPLLRLAALMSFMEKDDECGTGQASDTNTNRFGKIASTASKIMERLRMPVKASETVMFILLNRAPENTGRWTDAEVRHFISRIGIPGLERVLAIARAERMAANDRDGIEEIDSLEKRIQEQLKHPHPFRTKDLPVNGRDVMEMLNIRPGPEVGQILDWLRHEVLEKPELNQRKILLDLLRREYHESP